jgi:hypothetical protein
MTPNERRARLKQILDDHNEAARALREASAAFKATTMELVNAHSAIQNAATHADETAAYVRAVTTAIITANEAALALFNDDDLA